MAETAGAAGGHDEVRAAVERHRDLPLVDVIRLQRMACEHVGSRLYATILDAMAVHVSSGGVCAEVMGPWADNAMGDAIPLRLLGAVHRIVLDGRAPDLAAFYPSAGGTAVGDPWPAFLATVEANRDEVTAGMSRNVQTNEVGRACSLLGGFHRVSARTGLPLRTLEVGASAGLLMHWDRYGYEVGGKRWGAGEGPSFSDGYEAASPELDPRCRVVERRGCDVTPIDAATDDGALALRSFLWPDQIHRRARLDAAIDVARAHPTPIDVADAGDWVRAQLAEPRHGTATVVYHSIVLQYLPRDSFQTLRSCVLDAIGQAPANAPVFWLRMEPAGDVADIRLYGADTDGTPVDELLATSGYHGPPITWLG